MGCYIRNRKKHWYGATIPYKIGKGVSNKHRDEDGIDEWNDHTVARFIRRTIQKDYIEFVQTSLDFSSPIGKQGGMQKMHAHDF